MSIFISSSQVSKRRSIASCSFRPSTHRPTPLHHLRRRILKHAPRRSSSLRRHCPITPSSTNSADTFPPRTHTSRFSTTIEKPLQEDDARGRHALKSLKGLKHDLGADERGYRYIWPDIHPRQRFVLLSTTSPAKPDHNASGYSISLQLRTGRTESEG